MVLIEDLSPFNFKYYEEQEMTSITFDAIDPEKWDIEQRSYSIGLSSEHTKE